MVGTYEFCALSYQLCSWSLALSFSHLPNSCKILFYRCYILPLFDYADKAWCGLSAAAVSKLEIHHRKIIKRLFGKSLMHNSKHIILYSLVASSPLADRCQAHLCGLVQRIYHIWELSPHFSLSYLVVP